MGGKGRKSEVREGEGTENRDWPRKGRWSAPPVNAATLRHCWMATCMCLSLGPLTRSLYRSAMECELFYLCEY